MSIARAVVAMVGNPAANNGNGARANELVLGLLKQEGEQYGFDVVNLTGSDYEDSMTRVQDRLSGIDGGFDDLVVVGGDGMVALGVNALAGNPIPLGIVAMGSGNDFARGLGLPVNRAQAAVHGIAGAIVNGTHRDVDVGVISSSAATTDRLFAGMLSCGLDASINDRANQSSLPYGKLRYFAAVLNEVRHIRSYGYHVRVVLEDGSVDERDIASPLLTIANSRHVGGGIELSPNSLFDDGLLDLIWLNQVPTFTQIVHAISKAYTGGLLGTGLFDWQRVRSADIGESSEGETPPVLMADGECVGRLPVSVGVSARSMRLLVPPAVLSRS
ncbi:MAG: diacylglycerol kinase [Bifidobacterium tibiigranuli]|nr:diacylglycerol kinase [Bifidobacterium tibiigranuli]